MPFLAQARSRSGLAAAGVHTKTRSISPSGRSSTSATLRTPSTSAPSRLVANTLPSYPQARMLWRLTKPNFPGCVEAPATSTPAGLEQRPEPVGVGVGVGAGAGHQRTSTSASTATGRPSTTSSGLRSADARSPRSVAAARTAPAARRPPRPGRPPARRGTRPSSAWSARSSIISSASTGSIGTSRKRHVGHRLGQDAAHAEHDRHAELRVVVEPRDQLAGGPQHRRHQQVDVAVVGRRRRQQLRAGITDLLGRAQAEPDQPPLGLVGDAVARPA